jgi:hypothetical protein
MENHLVYTTQGWRLPSVDLTRFFFRRARATGLIELGKLGQKVRVDELTAKSISIKGPKRRSGNHVRKATEPASGDLLCNQLRHQGRGAQSVTVDAVSPYKDLSEVERAFANLTIYHRGDHRSRHKYSSARSPSSSIAPPKRSSKHRPR